MSRYGGAHVVVTGSAGFIGSHLVRALADDGARVTGLDRRTARADLPGVHLELDLTDRVATPLVRETLRDADLVFHLAGRPGVRGEDELVQYERRRDNVESTCRVLRFTRPSVPVVTTSSSSVYGGARTDGHAVRASRESDRLVPRGGYARSKCALEQECARRAEAGGLVFVARPFTVAGEGQRPDMALTRWLRAAAAGEPLTVYGSLSRARDVTDVAEVVRGVLAMAELDRPTTVNLGTGRAHSLGALVDAIAGVLGTRPDVRLVGVSGEDPPFTLADTTRCERLLGFRPTTVLAELVARQWRHVIDEALPPRVESAA